MPVAILKKVPVAGQKSARGNSKIAQNARAMAKLHVANLKKVPVHPQKMPVANYEGKFATGMKKCHGKKKTLSSQGQKVGVNTKKVSLQ